MTNRIGRRFSLLCLGVLLLCGILLGCDLQAKIPSGGAPSEWLKANTAGSATELQIHCLDIGQGDAILIRAGDKWTIIDTGDVDQRENLAKYLRKYGVKEVENLLITHAHSDHIGGAYTVLRQVPVRKAWDNGVPHTTATYRTFLRLLAEKNVPLTTARSGMRIDIGNGAYLQVLAPQEIIKKKGLPDHNNNSVIVRLVYGDFTMLFTGDAEKEEERDMLRRVQGQLRSTVLKVGHHGSKTSSTAEFLHAVRPQYAVISCGRGNAYGVPHEPVMERLTKRNIPIYRTDRDGTVTIRTDGTKIHIEGEYHAGNGSGSGSSGR